jgi:hypothetical protein
MKPKENYVISHLLKHWFWSFLLAMLYLGSAGKFFFFISKE